MVYVFLCDGFEELEALAPVDILRRGGIKVLTVGVNSKIVLGSHKIPVVCDCEISDISATDEIEAVVLPGGMPGTTNLKNSREVNNFIDFANTHNKLVCAICAAPSILGHKGLLKGKNATCFTGFEKDLLGAFVKNTPTVKDGNIITAFGAGAAFEFGFEILSALKDKNTAEDLRKSMRFGE